MIKKFKIFEELISYNKKGDVINVVDNTYYTIPKPTVNLIPGDFWKMVSVVNWKRVISDRNQINLAQGRLCKNFEYDEIKIFRDEYDYMYKILHEYFSLIWLNKDYSDIMPSDDGYSDLIGSIIGKGKLYTQKCINNHDLFLSMVISSDYAENFKYIFPVNEREYIAIRTLHDPVYRDTNKYNL